MIKINVCIIYSIIIILFIILLLYSRNYKKKMFKTLDKKENPLHILYGTSSFIFDLFCKKIYRFSYKSTQNKLEMIKARKVSNDETYIYIISKIAISLTAFLIIVSFGYISCIKSQISKEKKISTISRQDYGGGDRKYELKVVFKNGYKQNVELIIPEKKYSEKEAKQLFTDSYSRIIEKFIGNNTSTENITDNLNFISKDGNIEIQWYIDNLDYINYDGNILWENIRKKTKTKVSVIFNINKYSQEYTIPLTINPENRSKENKVNESLSQYIKDYDDESKKIVLIDKIDGENVYFTNKKSKPTFVYFLIGVVVAILLFLAKDKEMQGILEKRKRELETDYAVIINKIMILQNAGMSIYASWNKIIEDYNSQIKKKRYVYEEMKITQQMIKNGCSEGKAYVDFGKRCGTHSYVKLGNLLEQNIRKGTKGLRDILTAEVSEAFEERKVLAKKKGNEAGTKLLLPMGIMLVISMVIIIVPAFLSVNI